MQWIEKMSGTKIRICLSVPQVCTYRCDEDLQLILVLTILDADKALVDNNSKVTESQLRDFLDLCWVKYVKARIEPGREFNMFEMISCSRCCRLNCWGRRSAVNW